MPDIFFSQLGGLPFQQFVGRPEESVPAWNLPSHAEFIKLWNGIKDTVRREAQKNNKKYLLDSSVDNPFPAELLAQDYWSNIGAPIHAPQVSILRQKKTAMPAKNPGRSDFEVGQLGDPSQSAIVVALRELRDFNFDPDSFSCKGTPKEVLTKFIQLIINEYKLHEHLVAYFLATYPVVDQLQFLLVHVFTHWCLYFGTMSHTAFWFKPHTKHLSLLGIFQATLACMLELSCFNFHA